MAKRGRPRKHPIKSVDPVDALADALLGDDAIIARLDAIESILCTICETLKPNTMRPWQAAAIREKALKKLNGRLDAC